MSNISHAPIHTRFFAGLIDIIFLTAGGFLLYFLLHQLVVHQGFPPKAVTFFLNLYVLLTPLYFFYWKKVSGTPGNYFTGTAIITEGLRS
ncbi:RDD family protein, partial [bacterium]|nr:RDD family protein [bacterium]